MNPGLGLCNPERSNTWLIISNPADANEKRLSKTVKVIARIKFRSEVKFTSWRGTRKRSVLLERRTPKTRTLITQITPATLYAGAGFIFIPLV